MGKSIDPNYITKRGPYMQDLQCVLGHVLPKYIVPRLLRFDGVSTRHRFFPFTRTVCCFQGFILLASCITWIVGENALFFSRTVMTKAFRVRKMHVTSTM